jgi:hypothetical protein
MAVPHATNVSINYNIKLLHYITVLSERDHAYAYAQEQQAQYEYCDELPCHN